MHFLKILPSIAFINDSPNALLKCAKLFSPPRPFLFQNPHFTDIRLKRKETVNVSQDSQSFKTF